MSFPRYPDYKDSGVEWLATSKMPITSFGVQAPPRKPCRKT